MRPVGDMLITFATLPNAVAFDGAGDNSPFATFLSQHMKTPNVEISVLMKRVTRGVIKETEGKQRPQQLSQMQSEFYFARNAKGKITRDDFKSILSVYPAKVTTGDAVALVADVPSACVPAFFDRSLNGNIEMFPKKYFKQILLGSGQTRFEISPGSRFSLKIEEKDARGTHNLGYFCEPSNLKPEGREAIVEALGNSIAADQLQGKFVTEGGEESQFHFQSYEIE